MVENPDLYHRCNNPTIINRDKTMGNPDLNGAIPL
jgi:hypothetical protein